MKKIKLSNYDYPAFVDDEDYNTLSKFTWRAQIRNGKLLAVVRSVQLSNPRKVRHYFLHREILNITDSKVFVDHKDLNPLNNQKNNLRPCNRTQNTRNQGLNKNNTSGFKGVMRSKSKFKAVIKISNKKCHIGQFKTAKEAADAYDKRAKEAFGEFAKTNKELWNFS
jgi:hypothetical protein